jgi:hypothetical protein
MSFSFQCRSCGSRQGALVLDLGLQPLANNLLRAEDLAKPEPKFPLPPQPSGPGSARRE